MKTSTRIIILSFLLLQLTACSKEDKTLTPPPITKGNILGSVNLYNEKTNKIENEGMRVTIENYAPTIEAITDSKGKFVLKDVPFGTYTLIYEKEGFGLFKKYAIKHTQEEGTTVISGIPSLGKKSTTQISNLTVQEEEQIITIFVTTTPVSNMHNPQYIRFFYAKDKAVSNNNYHNFSNAFITRITPNKKVFTSTALTEMGFKKGERVYVKVYGDSFWSNQYKDLTTQKTYFPNLNTISAPAVSFIVP